MIRLILAGLAAASLSTATALAGPGPHLDGAGYSQARGGFGAAAQIELTRSESPAGAAPSSGAQAITVLAGDDWALRTGETATLYDFAQGRTVFIDPPAATMMNIATHALAQRNMEIYLANSDGGELDRCCHEG